MSWLRDFGSRNHPETLERKRTLQKSREGMAATPEMVANYTAARAFLLGEWFGASLVVASFTLLYLFAAVPGGPSVAVTLSVCLTIAAVGAFAFWRNHQYYQRLDFPWARRWHTSATVVAGSGAIFWLLFALLELLAALGIPIQ